MRRPCMWFCLLGIAVCVLWIHFHDGKIVTGNTQSQTVCLRGRISDVKTSNQKTILYLSEISGDGTSAGNPFFNNCIGVIAYLQKEERLYAGQFVVLEGKLEEIAEAGNPGEFSYRNYYRARGYTHSLKKAVLLSADSKVNLLSGLIGEVSKRFETVLAKYLSERDYGIMKAMLLGDKSDIEEEQKSLYQEIGIYHILAISGLHITFLGNFLYGIMNGLGVNSKLSMVTATLFLVLYAIMTGVSVSTVRAIIMFVICLGGKVFCRTYDLLTALSVAAFLTILWNPYVYTDGGFLLSYMAVLGIAILYPVMPGVDFRRVKKGDAIAVSFATWTLTLPVILSLYYEISLLSIPANLLILPTVSYLMLLGVCILAFHPFLPLLAQLCANTCHIVLLYYDRIVTFLDDLPFGIFVTGKPMPWKCVVFIAGVLVLSAIMKERKRKCYLALHFLSLERKEECSDVYAARKKKLHKKNAVRAGVEMAVLLGLIIFLIYPLSRQSEITILDVGQGDGICLNLGTDGVFMIDGGSSSRSEIGERVILPFLKSQGIRKIDGWFLTHPDKDHVSAISELEGNTGIQIKKIYLPGNLWEEFKEIRDFADNNHIEVCVLFAGDVVQLKKWQMEVISPSKHTDYEDTNGASLVLYLTDGNFRALMMGDAGTEAEKAVMKRGISDVTLLKVAHHGSAVGTNSEQFIQTVSARLAVVSCQKNNSYGHPHAETLQYLERSQSDVYRTDVQGAIRIRIGNRGVTVVPYRIPFQSEE